MSERAPSFKGLTPSSEASSRTKQHNRRRDTTQEVLLRKAVWRLGLRFRKNVGSLPGKPDIVFPRARVVVFCDGDFWHGRQWESLEAKLRQGSNAGYWTAKIAANRARDLRTTTLLEAGNWQVLRFWETDIKQDVDAVARQVFEAVRARERRPEEVH